MHHNLVHVDPDSFGVYVHIPFCLRRCDYCAFATWADKAHLVERYLDACVQEAKYVEQVATSVFFGGGTPSAVAPVALMRILDNVTTAADAEVTIECNPDTITEQHMLIYAQHGVNRVSIGMQSSVDHVLKSLGRTHKQENVEFAVQCALDTGIERINLDLIYGAAGESVDDWRRSLDSALSINGVTHISAYALTPEKGTPLWADAQRHPDDDDQAIKYEIADETLKSRGFTNYEISNWALPDEECRHNMLYWSQGNYSGIGCAAHSHVAGRRWWNYHTPEKYLAAIESASSAVAGSEKLSRDEMQFEAAELSLRTKWGVPVEALAFGELNDFLVVSNEVARLNRRGRLMANEISTYIKTDCDRG